MASGLLMGAICPVLRKIGKTENNFDPHLEVILPDHNANQLQCFLDILVSEQGPKTFEDQTLFTELLKFLAVSGQESASSSACFASDSTDFCTTTPIKNEEVEDIRTLELLPFQLPPSAVATCDLPKDSLDELLEWEEALDVVDTESRSNICNEDIPLSKSHKHKVKERKRRKKSVKEDDYSNENLHQEAKKCYDASKALYICNSCGIERKNTRSMQQHLIWHQKFPNEDFHTSHVCKECGKICGDHRWFSVGICKYVPGYT